MSNMWHWGGTWLVLFGLDKLGERKRWVSNNVVICKILWVHGLKITDISKNYWVKKGCECVTASRCSSTAADFEVQILVSRLEGSLTSVERLALIELSKCAHVWAPEGREDMIFLFQGVCLRGWRLKRASLSQSLPSPAPSHRPVSCSRSHNWKLIQSPLNGVCLNWVWRTKLSTRKYESSAFSPGRCLPDPAALAAQPQSWR